MLIFTTILLALLIEHIFWNASAWRQGDWFTQYYKKIVDAKSLARFSHQLANPGWLLGPLILLVAILQFILLPSLGDLVTWLFGLGALLFCLGPRNLGRDIEDYVQAKAEGQTQHTQQIARYFAPTDPNLTDPDQQVQQGLLLQANQSLLGPIFGFILFGAIGAVLYRAVHYLAQMPSTNKTLIRSTQILQYWVDWLPTRITLLGYAVVGHFEAVVSTWQQAESSKTVQDQSALLISAGQAALADHQATGHAGIIAHWTLVKRNLLLWTLIIGAMAFSTVW